MVTVKNVHNDVESTFTNERWAEIQKDAKYNGLFVEVKKPETPKEVKEIEKAAKPVETKAAEKVSDKK